jgi:hypothetical protein
MAIKIAPEHYKLHIKSCGALATCLVEARSQTLGHHQAAQLYRQLLRLRRQTSFDFSLEPKLPLLRLRRMKSFAFS